MTMTLGLSVVAAGITFYLMIVLAQAIGLRLWKGVHGKWSRH